MPFIIILVIILAIILYMIKLNKDLIVNKDNILRSMAALDAIIIKKNLAVLDLLGYAQEVMEKEANLIKDLFNKRHDINKIKPKISNAPARYQFQSEFENLLKQFFSAVQRYPELNKNAAFQKSLADYNTLETVFEEKIDFYNLCVDKLNWSIHTFPSSILAQLDHTKEPPPPYQK